MNIIKFSLQFPDEKSCILHFKAQRDARGVVCPKCGCMRHYWLQNKLRYECKQCHYRQSLRTGTVMEHSKLPFMYWYIAHAFAHQHQKVVLGSRASATIGA